MATALFIGRFQPLHTGHVKAVKHILSKEDGLALGIGSAQYENTLDNPFTLEERRRMLEAVFADSLDRIKIFSVTDIHNEPRWVAHVLDAAPAFDVVYTSSEVEARLFKDAGYRVVRIPFFERGKYRGTDIREKMASCRQWRNLVPGEAVKVIDDLDGVDRIKKITSKSS
ncbi:MAG: nicotinamide-nucleotide adenylyltransferase [Candidatus Altiarchaeota archaeon]